MFGAVHFIYIWEGDILFSYAVAATPLLIVLYGRALPILIACAVLVGLGLIPDADSIFAVAGGLAATGLLALYLRGKKRLTWRGVSMPVFSSSCCSPVCCCRSPRSCSGCCPTARSSHACR